MGSEYSQYHQRLKMGCESCLMGPYKKLGCPLPAQSCGKLEPSTENFGNEGVVCNWDQCPVPYIEDGLEMAHFFYDILETNILPISGGWSKQTPVFMQMWKLFKLTKSSCDSEKRDMRELERKHSKR